MGCAIVNERNAVDSWPSKSKINALVLAMSAEIAALREVVDCLELAPELAARVAAAKAETQAAALAVGCRPDVPLNS